MQVANPLVPSAVGSSGAAPALVANAPHVPDSSRPQTPRPVTGSKETDRERSDDGGSPRSERRGSRVDIRV